MMHSLNIEFFGYFAAILTTFAFLPQLIKTLKTKKADDVSLVTLIMFICGVVFWIIYGYAISSLPITINPAAKYSPIFVGELILIHLPFFKNTKPTSYCGSFLQI